MYMYVRRSVASRRAVPDVPQYYSTVATRTYQFVPI